MIRIRTSLKSGTLNFRKYSFIYKKQQNSVNPINQYIVIVILGLDGMFVKSTGPFWYVISSGLIGYTSRVPVRDPVTNLFSRNQSVDQDEVGCKLTSVHSVGSILEHKL